MPIDENLESEQLISNEPAQRIGLTEYRTVLKYLVICNKF